MCDVRPPFLRVFSLQGPARFALPHFLPGRWVAYGSFYI
jgi:hypothetical protein